MMRGVLDGIHSAVLSTPWAPTSTLPVRADAAALQGCVVPSGILTDVFAAEALTAAPSNRGWFLLWAPVSLACQDIRNREHHCALHALCGSRGDVVRGLGSV